jgi:hypothetical protein
MSLTSIRFLSRVMRAIRSVLILLSRLVSCIVPCTGSNINPLTTYPFALWNPVSCTNFWDMTPAPDRLSSPA